MALIIPDRLLALEANSGVFAIWMVLHHHGISPNIEHLIKTCHYVEREGTYTIALALALKNYGFEVSFFTDIDPHIEDLEAELYQQAKHVDISVLAALSYQDIQNKIKAGYFVIVYYDNLEGVGQQSLIHSITDQDICFFDSFDEMPKAVFEQQRSVDGICRQVILIDDRNFSSEVYGLQH